MDSFIGHFLLSLAIYLNTEKENESQYRTMSKNVFISDNHNRILGVDSGNSRTAVSSDNVILPRVNGGMYKIPLANDCGGSHIVWRTTTSRKT